LLSDTVHIAEEIFLNHTAVDAQKSHNLRCSAISGFVDSSKKHLVIGPQSGLGSTSN